MSKLSSPAGVLLVLCALGLAGGAVVWGTHWKSLATSEADAGQESEALGYLEEEVDFLRDENDRLLDRIYEIEAGGVDSVENFYRPLELEQKVQDVRGLLFEQAIEYEVVDQSVIELAVQKQLSASYDDQTFEAMSLAWGAMAFTEPMMNLQQSWITVAGSAAVFYDPDRKKILVRKEVDPENPFDVPLLAREICLALLDQHGADLAAKTSLKGDIDSGLARRAFYLGQAALVADIVGESTIGEQSIGEMPNYDTGVPPVGLPSFPVPEFVRQVVTFPVIDGVTYCATLREEAGGFAVFDELVERELVPQSTREVIDGVELDEGEREALRKRISAAKTSDLSAMRVTGSDPIFIDTAGAFGMRTTFETFLGMAELPGPGRDQEENEPRRVAAGWLADSYAVFAVGEEDLHLVWESCWESKDAADAFVADLNRISDLRLGMTPEDSMTRDDAYRFQKVVRVAEDRLLFIDASNKDAVVELETAWRAVAE